MGIETNPGATQAELCSPEAAVSVATPPPAYGDLLTLSAAGVCASPSSGNGPPAMTPGAAFGPRYRIISILGRGGMGTVYKAYDRELNRDVALKLVRLELTSQPNSMQRFKQELLLASKVSHKNILRIHDLGDVNGIKFFSMAYVDGEDLHCLLKRVGRLPLEQILSIGRQLCQALEAAHAEGVVHRDLKPQNILLDALGHAYVSDFGLAKSLESDSAAMTQTGVILGTPQYMSPEQVEGAEVDHRSDIYALGLIFYEMAAGESPFAGETAMQVMYRRLKEEPRDPRSVNRDLPAYLGKIILRCLERDPAKRYQSASELLLDLDQARSPTLSRGQRATQVTLTLPTSRRGFVIAAALAALMGLLLIIPPTRHVILRPFQWAAPASGGSLAAGQGRFVAILPFRVLGDQASLGYIAEGLEEALSSKLFQLKDVRVASMNSVQSVDPKTPLSKLAGELGVNLVVNGTLQSGGGRIAIIVNLQDALHNRLLWTQEFSGVPQDLLTLEDQIYNKLADVLEPNRGAGEQARASAPPTENLAAYDLYLKGKDLMRGKPNPEKIQAALEDYDRALQMDPNFALAYAGIADASLELYDQKKDRFWADKALTAAEQAERLNNNLPDVYSSLGNVYTATGKTSEAIAMLQQAVKLAPRSDDAYRRLGDAYLADGRTVEALQAYRKAVQINPYYWNNYAYLGFAYYQNGEYDKALKAFQQVTRLEPDNAVGYENIGDIYFLQGEYQQSISAFQKAFQLHPSYDIATDLGNAYFFLRRYHDAVTTFAKAVQMNPNQAVAVANLADAYRWSGQDDEVRSTYNHAIELGVKDLQVNPRDSEAMGLLAVNYAKTGNLDEAMQFIRRAQAIDKTDLNLIYDEAVVQELSGHPQEALDSLRDALSRGFSQSVIQNDPQLDALRTNPGFKALIKSFGKERNR
jgi:serine/threonine protein kinase/Flp pilus assembly protein TadD